MKNIKKFESTFISLSNELLVLNEQKLYPLAFEKVFTPVLKSGVFRYKKELKELMRFPVKRKTVKSTLQVFKHKTRKRYGN